METNCVDVTLIQETWLPDNFEKGINGFRMTHHVIKTFKSNRGERGVATILSPTFVSTYKDAGELPPTMSLSLEEETHDRFLSISLKLKCWFNRRSGAFRKRKPKNVVINLTIASIYFPVKNAEHE